MGRRRGFGPTDLRVTHRTGTAPCSGEDESLDPGYVAVESARRHARAAASLADERARGSYRRRLWLTRAPPDGSDTGRAPWPAPLGLLAPGGVGVVRGGVAGLVAPLLPLVLLAIPAAFALRFVAGLSLPLRALCDTTGDSTSARCRRIDTLNTLSRDHATPMSNVDQTGSPLARKPGSAVQIATSWIDRS